MLSDQQKCLYRILDDLEVLPWLREELPGHTDQELTIWIDQDMNGLLSELEAHCGKA